jgi:hypothetical protein
MNSGSRRWPASPVVAAAPPPRPYGPPRSTTWPTATRRSTLRVRLDEDTWKALDEEAARQGVSADTLAVHAVLYFLADLDSGRLADLLGKALEESE